MRRTNIPGHALRSEGAAYECVAWAGTERRWQRVGYGRGSHEGVALCECGETSPPLESDAARKRWHRDIHKPAVRGASGGAPGPWLTGFPSGRARCACWA
jgi:hypothetical protein